MLELRSLTKEFGKTIAVNDLSITCEEREFLVIFGPAGAGKTTTLRMIAGVLQPTRGEIYFRGQSLKGVPPEHRNMSMVFEYYALYSHLSVFENLAFPLKARGYSGDEIRQLVGEMAGILQISELLDRRPGFLSGGQRQRVALGRALIRDADVYLLDEPISHLDAKLRHRMRGELKAMCAEKDATVVHVTHDSREAMALSDKVAVINKGRLMQLGAPAEIFDQPANEFVAGFVGEPPMSFVDVEYTEEDSQPVFRITGTDSRLPASLEVDAFVKDKGLPDTFRLGARATEVGAAHSRNETYNVPGEVFVTETLGHRNILTARLGKNLVQLVTPPELTFQVQDTVWLNLSQENLHVFADGLAVTHPVRHSD
ncbi:MAG: ATP-binding cassette domain-containing protein [Anaerolineae bacterium]|nr:ATP-binding cassette domain-containing protein [Anaerolineae bacterium]NIN98011.1 ATP-binding cassette domain-containing protein [Anaerolineae bacterium]NIQ80956.1 ATP-binding cassette domain-containing protein [Anaerolineae bacterium]